MTLNWQLACQFMSLLCSCAPFSSCSFIFCLFSFSQKVYRTQDALATTMVRRNELYPSVHNSCEQDLPKFCEADPFTTDMGENNSTALLGGQSDLFVINSTLTQSMSSSPSFFPFECLETAWMDERVSPACNSALFNLQVIWVVQHQYELNVKAVSWILRVIWTFTSFYLIYAYMHAQRMWFKWVTGGRELWVGPPPVYLWVAAIWGFVFGLSMFAFVSIVAVGFLFQYWYGKKEDVRRIDDECSSDSKQVDSDDPSVLTESCCDCCKGTGVCNAACIKDAVSDAATEKEVLVSDEGDIPFI